METTEIRSKLEESIALCDAQMGRGKLTLRTRNTYVLHARNFVRWLEGGFVPGEGRQA